MAAGTPPYIANEIDTTMLANSLAVFTIPKHEYTMTRKFLARMYT